MRGTRTVGPRGIHSGLSAVVLALTLAGCGPQSSSTRPGGEADRPDQAIGGPVDSLWPTAIHYAVTGMVRDATGRPVVGTMITAVSLDRPAQPVPELAVLTDARGHYGWPSLKPGRYELRANAPGGTAAVPVVVPARGTATADLTLLGQS